jgi:hypothetical protein
MAEFEHKVGTVLEIGVGVGVGNKGKGKPKGQEGSSKQI